MFKRSKLSISVLGVAITLLLGIWNQSNTQVVAHEGDDHHTSTLLAENRDGIEVCVQSFVPDELNIKAKEKVESLIKDDLMTNNKWNKLFHDLDITVKTGCEVQPYLMEEGTSHPVLSGTPDSGRIVSQASSSMLTVFVVPNKTIEKHFKSSTSRISPEEILCQEDVCREVTTGVYLSLTEFKNKNILEQALSEALGLDGPKKVDDSNLPENRER
ncbi:MAG: hypothetical protein H0Z34_16855 [Brevibacillus sp.]|nr:hypothetical protein [Brevibacillus sp.]